jgi:small subunit ribosomal protein S21
MIVVRQGHIERAIRDLKKEFERSGIAKELRKRRYFIKPSEQRRMEIREGIKKFREREQKKDDRRCRSVR